MIAMGLIDEILAHAEPSGQEVQIELSSLIQYRLEIKFIW